MVIVKFLISSNQRSHSINVVGKLKIIYNDFKQIRFGQNDIIYFNNLYCLLLLWRWSVS